MADVSVVPVMGDPWNGGAFPVSVSPRTMAAAGDPGLDAMRVGFVAQQPPQDASLWRGIKGAAADMGQGLLSAITFPRDAMEGKVEPLSDDGIARSFGMAGLAIGGAPEGLLSKLGSASEAPEILASRSASLYNPTSRQARPFDADYPMGAAGNDVGNLTHDIDGRPLTASFVAGRRSVGGPDEAFSPAQTLAVGEGSAGARYSAVPSGQLGGDAGRVVVSRDPITGVPTANVLLDRRLSHNQLDQVSAHETGHIIDELAGKISTSGLSNELKEIYNTGNNGNRNYSGTDVRSSAKPVTPQSLGYKSDEVPREYMAEAIRAYMADPNAMKTVAPKTAAAIRSAVNSNPRLNGVVQFNAGSPAAAGVASSLGQDRRPSLFDTLVARGLAT